MDMFIKYLWPNRLVAKSLFLFCALFFSIQANSSNPVPVPSKKEGLLLLDLQVEAPSAVMSLQAKGYKRFDLKLESTHGRWLVKSLPKGEYQIMEIRVPYFDLPYRKGTEQSPLWRFKIQPGHINYVGRIEVAKERTEDFVVIKRLNRLIADLPNIQQDFATALADFPLADGSYIRDDFAAASLGNGVSNE